MQWKPERFHKKAIFFNFENRNYLLVINIKEILKRLGVMAKN